jgi:hypothetical protein
VVDVHDEVGHPERLAGRSGGSQHGLRSTLTLNSPFTVTIL